ncbi:MAG: hypothetical protein ACR2J3_09030 [Aridibacter sp.]
MNYFNYFTDIEETFIRRRGKHLLLSPLDWALIESWQERGIPLRIVLRGIENVFDGIDKKPNHTRTIKSLMYCKEEIETQYAEWLKTQVGKSNNNKISEEKIEKNQVVEKKIEEEEVEEKHESSLFSKETIENHLENITKALNQAKAKSKGILRQVLEKVLIELNKHEKTYKNAEGLEESLNHLESLIDETLLKTADKESISKIKSESEKNLAKHKSKMEAEVYQRTFDLMLYKNLREQAKIPRLSLFYL